MDYDELKRLLKERTSHQDKFNEYDEAVFVEALDREIEKASHKHRNKRRPLKLAIPTRHT